MYSDKKNVLELVALLKAHCITQIVLCPGSRNSPLIHSLATDSDFVCYSVVDERSAGFFALGVIQATGKPTVVCCTSGTATLNLGSAVAEAYYQELPLLVISADRPQGWIGQMDGQTIPQHGVFGNMVHQSVNLPEVNNSDDLWYCNRLINEAIIDLDIGKKGPTHINVPLSEPLFNFTTETLPEARVIRRSSFNYKISDQDNYAGRFLSYAKKMIVVGQLPSDNNLSALLYNLSSVHNAVIISDHLSNVHNDENRYYDLVLRTASSKALEVLEPELLITLGGHAISKSLKHFLRNAKIKENWHISPYGDIIDTYKNVTDIVEADNNTFLEYLADINNYKGFIGKQSLKAAGDAESYKKLWSESCAKVISPVAEFSDLYVTGELLKNIPDNASLQLASSHSVYLSQFFEIPSSVDCFSNRGTNGIDGSISTAVGYAAVSDKLTVLLTGDLSFFYDMNGIWNRHTSPNLRILINNNGGGGVFDTLSGLNSSEALNDYITVNHKTSAKGWAEEQGFIYITAKNSKDLQEQLSVFLDPDLKSPVILEVFTSMDTNSKQIGSFYQQQ